MFKAAKEIKKNNVISIAVIFVTSQATVDLNYILIKVDFQINSFKSFS